MLRNWSRIGLLLGIALLSFCCAGLALGAAWRAVELKFPGNEDRKLNITAIGISGPGQVYLGTSTGRFYLWNGKTLEEIKHEESGDPAWQIRNIVVNDTNDIWAFGDNGFSLRFDGKSWQPVRNPLTGTGGRKSSLWAAACVKSDLCFAGSHDGRLIQWDGKRWQETTSPVNDSRIYGIQFTSSDSGWMVGDGFFASWDGKRWEKADLQDVPRMYDLALVGRDWGWAVGDRGAFFNYDGKNWKRADVKGSLFRLYSVACTTETVCWTVGEAGAVFRWDGSRWARVRLGTVNRLITVKMQKGENLIGGDKATLFEGVGNRGF